MTGQRSLWSSIPTHLLNTRHTSAVHARFFSHSTRRRADSNDSGKDKKSSPASLAESFGFQSLSGLFQQEQPLRGRYSRPRDPAERSNAMTSTDERKRDGDERSPVETNKGRVDNGFFTPTHGQGEQETSPFAQGNYESAQTAAPPTKTSSNGPLNASTQTEQAANASSDTQEAISGVPSRRPRIILHSVERPMSDRQRQAHAKLLGRQRQTPGWKPLAQPNELSMGRRDARRLRREGRRPNPFGYSSPDTKKGESANGSGVQDGAWGLSESDMATVDTLADPDSSASAAPATTASAATDSKSSAHTGAMPAASFRRLSAGFPIKLKARAPMSAATSQAASKLTHLTASGEAHMVDVGAKAATKRTAIASGYVRFSNPAPFHLAFENSNKKGDVLGVARVAGIMAAKRTSDLIPLCHPISISKIEVDVKLLTPNSKALGLGRQPHGAVSVQALVECTGPTGVEMEALTAISGAALTVYDMCKAVDKHMQISGSRVVYKSGGRSGLYCSPPWASTVGREFFEERALALTTEAEELIMDEEKKGVEGGSDGNDKG